MQSPVSHRVRKLKRRSTSPIGTATTSGANHVCPASPITSRFDEELAKIIDYSDLSDTDDSQPDSGTYLKTQTILSILTKLVNNKLSFRPLRQWLMQ